MLRITARVAGGVDVPLPAWSDWDDLIADGLMERKNMIAGSGRSVAAGRARGNQFPR
jgi:hypothetical protein